MMMMMMMMVMRVVVVVTVAVMVSVAERQLATPDQELPPVFLEPVPNVTVAVGRDASLTCSVDNLGQHKVAWIHLNRKMIVSIHKHVITRQPRFTVTHDSHKTWTLNVHQVTQEDRGHYMCQVNSAPMISQKGYLQVVVPPNIVDRNSSKSNIVVREKQNVTLSCRADGFPKPVIKWRREDAKAIQTSDGRNVNQLDGATLGLRQVSRTHMGAYLCIASNGVPPSVSKRITLDVEFAPQMHVPNQLLGAPLGTDVQLECFVEAHPRAITYWENRDAMVMNTTRITTHTLEDHYKIHMVLSIRDLREDDFGMYKCISKNSIAETDGSITLNKTYRPTSPPTKVSRPGVVIEDFGHRSRRPGRKEELKNQDLLEESSRRQQQQEEEEEKRRRDESRRLSGELERADREYNRGHHTDAGPRVTQSAGVSGGAQASKLSINTSSASCIYIFLLLLLRQQQQEHHL